MVMNPKAWHEGFLSLARTSLIARPSLLSCFFIKKATFSLFAFLARLVKQQVE